MRHLPACQNKSQHGDKDNLQILSCNIQNVQGPIKIIRHSKKQKHVPHNPARNQSLKPCMSRFRFKRREAELEVKGRDAELGVPKDWRRKAVVGIQELAWYCPQGPCCCKLAWSSLKTWPISQNTCDHHGTRRKENHSEMISEHRQNIVQAMKYQAPHPC